MEFIKRTLISGALFYTVVYLLEELGLDSGSAKFKVISLLSFWGLVFFFMHPYMTFIGLLEAPERGMAENEHDGIVWKFLAVLFFIVAAICLMVW